MKQIRPCHTIHCRHYDLSDGMMCEVEARRIIEAMKANMRFPEYDLEELEAAVTKATAY